LNNRVE